MLCNVFKLLTKKYTYSNTLKRVYFTEKLNGISNLGQLFIMAIFPSCIDVAIFYVFVLANHTLECRMPYKLHSQLQH